MLDAREVLREGMWEGRRAFVVGSGPSLQNFDRTFLKRERTIGVNEEWRWEPTIAFHSDIRLLRGDGLKKGYRDDGVYLATKSIKVYHKAHEDREEIDAPDPIAKLGTSGRSYGTSLSGIVSRANAGLSALNLADVLGADPIYLLGFDCGADGKKTHSHEHYPPEWQQIPKDYIYRRWADAFADIAPKVKARVINLCPWSLIACFEKQDPVMTFLKFKDAAGQPEYEMGEVYSAFENTPLGKRHS